MSSQQKTRVLLVVVVCFLVFFGGRSLLIAKDVSLPSVTTPTDASARKHEGREDGGLGLGKAPQSSEAIRAFVQGNISCGEVCSYAENVKKQGKFFPQLRKQVDCINILGRLMTYQPAKQWPPPEEIPKELYNSFTIDGKCPVVQKWYFKQKYSGGEAMVNKWSREYVQGFMENRKKKIAIGNYGMDGDNCVQFGLESVRDQVVGKVGLVVGSETPWVEAISLVVGAKEVHTLEYGYISVGHPQLAAFLPPQFALRMLKEGPQYDFVVSYSSLEHSGLGRYGDAINPFGDLEAMAQVWCSLKPGGIAIIAVPVKTFGTWKDCGFAWNAHRYYGLERFKHLWANFEILSASCEHSDQPVIVGRKLE